ncbi:cupin domain-containing protein [uncultured Pluralibacter sp.]|uniref:cupin domain-containing protein n=1 Tax=uncultured Pluralibacter sp. TaxID=1490864 RepID=UPI00261381B3|nr:cupin domain-containing protein [uncultured Pluralibacter sp.]
MKSALTALSLSAALLFTAHTATARADDAPSAKVEKLLETQQSWDGAYYKAYPRGVPQLTVLKITIAPGAALAWHKHPIPSAAYIQSGELTIEKKATGEKKVYHAGEVLAETVDTIHRGTSGKEGATLIVFYAGQKGVPLAIPEK